MSFLKNDPAMKQMRRKLRRNQTDAERFFWAKVRSRQFFGLKFFRQYSFGPYILDFYCPEKKLAVELDGGQHNLSVEKEYDAARTNYLNAQAVEVVRFWNNDILIEIDAVLASLELKVTNRNLNPTCPPLI